MEHGPPGAASSSQGPAGRRGSLPPATTIYDVAREAGVAPSTVSRAFANPRRVSARTREHVLAVAERLGYQPNPLARALPSGRTQTLALLVPDITNPHFFGLIRGAERQAAAAGFTLILSDTEESPDLELRHVERLARVVDGFMLASSRLPDGQLRKLAGAHVLVLANREAGGIPSVVTDQSGGSRQIVEHLASLGHRSLAFLAGPQASWAGAQRWAALAATARRLGVAATRLGPFPPAMAGGAAAADAALGHGASAVVAHNDLLAIGMLRRLAQRGVRVPEDLSVVGYDNIFGADFCSPPLTTLAGSIEAAGRAAVDLLLRLLDRHATPPASPRTILPSHLLIRGSTGQAIDRADHPAR